MALKTEVLDASMTWVLERATGTCLSLSCLAEAQQLQEMACLGLPPACEAEEKELAGKAWLQLQGGGGSSSKQQCFCLKSLDGFGWTCMSEERQDISNKRSILPHKPVSRRGFRACLCSFGDPTFVLARLRQGAESTGAGLELDRTFSLEIRALLYRDQTVPNPSHSWIDRE
ncbi:hypothetical protein AAES_66493 [Amazona aestiva]|uniref:Uncharacterized protein n=1 Tax=Amazona aestiva TaxID=12930 RepID=A0A0Q3MK31_AMAAE|nr:hypothetical protein AAES_66493 [Amazona aestiva]